MSRNYKFHNPEGLYFVSFAVVNWIDIFVREVYFEIMVESLKHCQKEKGLQLYAWCIMPSHVHLVFKTKENKPSDILRDLKRHTSKKLQKAIAEYPKESRKEWVLWMMERAGKKNSNVKNKQFWQQNNQPIELWSNSVIEQKVDYVHNNPVAAGFVNRTINWKYSSARSFAGKKGEIELDVL